MFFQHWAAPNGNTIVIYNPFTDEQRNIQLNLPNPYIVIDGGGRDAWVRADIDPSLKRVLYNDKDGRLVLWDLDTQKEIAFLPSPTDVTVGKWSPDGTEFATPWPSPTSDATELFIIDIHGAVTKLTNFNQKYPFANIDTWPSWSPDGRHIAFWLKISNAANSNPDTLRQWLAITDTTTLDTQIYCLSPNTPPARGENIVWSPDSQFVIVNSESSSRDVKPTLVDLTHHTQSKLDTHGLWVDDWTAP
jgi:Tol biopolymer transport system component